MTSINKRFWCFTALLLFFVAALKAQVRLGTNDVEAPGLMQSMQVLEVER